MNNQRTIIEFSTTIETMSMTYGVGSTTSYLNPPEVHVFRVVITGDLSTVTAWEQVDGPMGEATWWQISGDRLLCPDHTSKVAHLPQPTVVAMALMRIAGMADLGRETRHASRFIDLHTLPSPPCAIAPDPA